MNINRRYTYIILTAAIGSFTMAYASNGLSVILPTLASYFHISNILENWIVYIYLLILSVAGVPLAKICGKYGLKRSFKMGLLIFSAGSLISALSFNVIMMIAGRILQAVGASMTFVTNVSMITAEIPPSNRGHALGINVTGVYLGITISPTISGILVHNLSWRFVFLITVVLALISYCLLCKIDEEWIMEKQRLDKIGSILYMLAIGLLLYGFTILNTTLGIILVALSLIILAIFVRYELKQENPVYEMQLFKNINYTTSNIIAMIAYLSTYVVSYVLNYHFQYIMNLDAQTSGLILISTPVMMLLIAAQAGKLSDRINPAILQLVGVTSINSINSELTANNNIPTPTLTDENYNQFFDENGIYKGSELINLLEIGSDIYNKNFTFNTKITIDNPNHYTIYNTTITNTENEQTLTNLIINNTNYPYPTIITSNMILEKNKIYQSGDNLKVIVLENATQGGRLQYNNITCDGDNNIIISCKNISIDTFMQNSILAKGSNITAMYYNTTAIDELFEEPISVFMLANKIKIDTETPTTAVIFDNSAIEFQSNEIIITTYNNQTPIIKSTNTVDGYINGNYLESFDLVGDDAVDTDGIKRSNTPRITDGYAANMDVILPEHFIVNSQNTIIVNVTDKMGNEVKGTITIEEPSSIIFNPDGTITMIEGKSITSNENMIKYTPTNTGRISLDITYTDPTGKYNPISKDITITVKEPTLTVDPITATVGQTINITARITAGDETITNINKGKVTFKVKGKTLKDTSGKVIYAKIVNGTATIENYVVPNDWAKEDITIQAVYSGSTECNKLTSEKTNITIAKAVPTLTTEDVTATVGGKITLKATITDNDKVINTGKIVFKINGKTVKDENGKVIYAKVVNNTVEFEYTLPESYKANVYNITATFISPDYDRLTDTKTLTITA